MTHTKNKKNTGDNCAHISSATIEYFLENLKSLKKWCESRWNGSGGAVYNQAFLGQFDPQSGQKKYPYMTFSLAKQLFKQAARDMGLNDVVYTDSETIYLPPTERAAERLDAHNAAAEPDPDGGYNENEIKLAKKMLRKQKKTGQQILWGVSK